MSQFSVLFIYYILLDDFSLFSSASWEKFLNLLSSCVLSLLFFFGLVCIFKLMSLWVSVLFYKNHIFYSTKDTKQLPEISFWSLQYIIFEDIYLTSESAGYYFLSLVSVIYLQVIY